MAHHESLLGECGKPYELDEKSGTSTRYLLMTADASKDLSRQDAATKSANNLLYLWRLAKFWAGRERLRSDRRRWISPAYYREWFKLQVLKVRREF